MPSPRTTVAVLHVKVFRAGIGRMGFKAVLGDEPCDPDDGGEFDLEYAETPRQAVDALMEALEKRWAMMAWDDFARHEPAGRRKR